MAIDPRKYTITKCTRSNDMAKRDFFDSIGKIGDLEALKDFGLGGVADGFRVLGSVSDAIRIGEKIIPGLDGATDAYNTTIGKVIGTARDAVNEGAQIVLDAIGLGTAIEQVANFSPEVANRAWGEAKNVYQRVKDGNLDWNDVPSLLQDFQNLELLARGVFTPGESGNRVLGNNVTMCDPSPYATDLIAFGPKFKFLFIIQIEWNPAYAPAFKDLEAAFVVKNSTRPNVNVEYEDINMYNFKTQVPKRVMYQPMTMRFYDDNWNQAMLLWNAYLKSISPISNMNFTDQGIAASGVFEESAMDFNSLGKGSAYGVPAHDYSASYGVPYDGSSKDIFKQINLFHVYREGRLMNVYQFYNPRIQNFVLDDVDMADGSSGNEVEFSFVYDALHVSTGLDLNPVTRKHKWDIEGLSGSHGRALWPIIFNGADLASSCVNKDINIKGESGIESDVVEQQMITTTADSLVGQTEQVGLLDGITSKFKSGFKTLFQDSQRSGPRQEAQVEAKRVIRGEEVSESFWNSAEGKVWRAADPMSS